MKSYIIILGFLMLLSCRDTTQERMIPQFKEQGLSFAHLKNGYEVSNSSWIKSPENILMLHETFKKRGYDGYVWNTDRFWFLDVNKAPKHLVDSLELSFHFPEEFPKYYREFWARRTREGNHAVVYKVLRELKEIMIDGIEIQSRNEMVNDTLYQLLYYKNQHKEYLDHEANNLLEYLVEIGLHQSAYNVRSGEHKKFDDVKWDKALEDDLSRLEQVNSSSWPWFEDDSK